ncbi:MAG: N-formylglutamate amidohydrolase [Proteobacteria bacterium]|nr:N-formylglutamate amidohydrolase [Pseudomonadota bacterium]
MHINGVLRVYHPRQAKAVPVLIDSPHSGRTYPADFNHACQREALQVYEDRFMDLLLSGLPHKGFTVVQAEMPRSYIDLNRAYDDISEQLVPQRQLGDFALKPSLNSQRGTGLIWTYAGDVMIYDRLPDPDSIEARINTYYWPYYAALEREVTRIRERFGSVWHLNMHSMPPTTNNGAFDVVLGDLDGRSCGRGFVDVVENAFVNAGLKVTRNKPYKGAQLTKTIGRPDNRQESLQIEISKGLYLKHDLITLDRDKFLRLQGVIETVMAEAAIFARSQLPNTASNADARAASS